MMDMVIDTVELLDHLEWKSNVHLVGASMGGMISLQLLAHYPQYFTSACLISTSAKIVSERASVLISLSNTM
jgi:homoserine acetyltransferase